MAQPSGTVALVVALPASRLPEALRALGIPFVLISAEALTDVEKSTFATIIVDEMATEDPTVRAGFSGLIELTRRRRANLVVLRQGTATIHEIATSSSSPLRARDVPFGVNLVAPRPEENLLRFPNRIAAEDLDSLARQTTQFATAYEARALLAGNLDRPDSSAALLEVQVGGGTVHYVSCLMVARAAEGYPAEQRLMANLLSR